MNSLHCFVNNQGLEGIILFSDFKEIAIKYLVLVVVVQLTVVVPILELNKIKSFTIISLTPFYKLFD